MPTRITNDHDLSALADVVAASTDSIMRRLTESEKFLQRVETVSRVGGFMVDFASGEHQWTRQTFRIHEIDENCCPTRELLDSFLTPAARERLHEANRVAHETGIGYDIEIPLVTAKKRAIWVRVAAEVECEDGVPVRIVGAIQDITERCKLEHRLRDAIAIADKASKSKSEFLANMSHEIRTPLNAVIGLGYLLEQTSLSEDQRQFLTKIQFAGRALLGVVNNVLDLSKIEAGEMSLEDQPFDLIELVRDVSQMLQPQAAEKNIELMFRPARDALPRMVMGDALRVRQILTNLLNNAIKFTERGHVTLAAFCTERGAGRIRLRCEVADTGIGIEPGACERLFTPFTQADASTTRRFGGTGLGLSIARRFVELMGGEIGVLSTPGAGSTFWIEIPLRTASDVGGSITTNGLRILVLDSHGDPPQGLGAMVRALGWSPQAVETAGQLISFLNDPQEKARPDAIIVDLHERGADAHELIARIERGCDYGEMPAVIVVAESEQCYLSHKQHMRPLDVLLVRPVTSSALFNAINMAMSRRPEINERVFVSTNFDELHAQWLSGVRVLVVDDSDINLEVAQRILEKQGAIVTTCSDGPSALAHLRACHRPVDLVLMDVQMPGLDGNEVTRRIRSELPLGSLPIVALTAGALVGERQRSLDAGMNDFVSKPFDPQVLIRKVRRLVESARGEPIPMVFDDTKPMPTNGDRPFLKSVDAGVVQQMFGDDLALFRSLLARMLRDFSDLSLPIAVSPHDRDASRHLQDRAHKLKGSAGMIGATSVMRYAGAVERALQDSRPADAVEGILKKLAAALTMLRDEAKVMLDEAPPRTATTRGGSSNDPCIDGAGLDELCSLLECQNLAAVDKFDLLSPRLAELLDAALFERLRSAVENLDFQIGADLLRGQAPTFIQPTVTAA
jgi:signal transduction histidine kinase/CheY-like chemotaxis protein/HPt (histidine-containing phosphotransfer) domain-containing protein